MNLSESLNFKKNLRWQMISSAGQVLVSAAVLVLVGRCLGTQGFGLYSVIMSYVLVTGALFEPRMQDVAAKQFWYLAQDTVLTHDQRQQLADVFSMETAGKALVFAGLVAVSPLLVRVSGLPVSAFPLIAAAAIGTFFSKIGLGLSLGLLRVVGRSDASAYCLVGELLLRLVLLAALAGAGMITVKSVIIVQSFTGALALLAQWMLIARYVIDIRGVISTWSMTGFARRARPVRRLFFSNLGMSWTDLMSKDLDVTLISPFVAVDKIGIYKMAKNLVMLSWRAVDPFFLAFMPEINRLVALGRFSDVRGLIGRSAAWLACIAIAVATATYSGAYLLGVVIFGHAYGAMPSLLPIMFAGIVCSAPLIWAQPLAVALGRPDIALVGSLTGAIAGVALLILLVPQYGSQGAGLAWTATFIFNFGITAWWSYRLLAGQFKIAVSR
jgi:O-antigen/teichoic acid export membrane protein